ncbi:hypothetical protein A3J77_00305 [Candidatus Wolfebacteria bacterium RBG_13_41_7]|uniref:Uncharacterized protein n=1 Tax=Candidatus Wolfebacteria bacterium RBG_13_41_7 TaxID=1802554 RepID=A0A1F8DQV6_9BACT|nr:MAG: hypothetical protein A3J77_00305 [Candidatus Wolfebacteria bacterium RBG_13_41_7]
MPQKSKLTNFSDIIKSRQKVKAPAYPWQELALRIIAELGVPNNKRNSVFKVCKENPRDFIIQCLDDTKELCQTGQCWKYFFKIANSSKK